MQFSYHTTTLVIELGDFQDVLHCLTFFFNVCEHVVVDVNGTKRVSEIWLG